MMTREDIEFMLQNVARQLAMIPTDELEEHLKGCRDSLRHADSIGCLIDPTSYLRDRDSGRLDDARNQEAIAEHLLAARKAIDVREQFVASMKPLAASAVACLLAFSGMVPAQRFLGEAKPKNPPVLRAYTPKPEKKEAELPPVPPAVKKPAMAEQPQIHKISGTGWVCHTQSVPSTTAFVKGKQVMGKHSIRVREFGVTNKKDVPGWHSWQAMWARCTTPTYPKFHLYGGRGIKVCERWEDFFAFMDDMGRRPSPKHSIERKDGNGDYCPENCVWATQTEQTRNTSKNVILTFQGKSQCISAWCEELGFPRHLVDKRLDRGWTVEKTLTTPYKPYSTERKELC